MNHEVKTGQASPETVNGIPKFSTLLKEVTFARNRAISSSITQIDLGIIDDHIMELSRLTQNDPRRRERAKLVLVTKSREILVQKNICTGSERHVEVEFTFSRNGLFLLGNLIPKQFIQDRFIGANMHSHPEDTPFSPSDLAALFYDDSEPISSSAELVVTSKRKMLVFRGPKTQSFGQSEAIRFSRGWVKRIEQKASEVLRFCQAEYSLNKLSQSLVFAEIVEEHGLRYFECPLNEKVLKLKT